MKLRLLNRTHPDYRPGTMRLYGDLFAGGAQFRANLHEYLPTQAPVEPPDVYAQRCKASHYLNYCGSICNFFASYLFSATLEFASTPTDVDDFYAAFKEDCDGLGTDLTAFLRARFVDALVKGGGFWRVKFPKGPEGETVVDRAAWERNGMGRGMLHAIAPEEITHWRKDSQGEYQWVVEHSVHRFIRDFGDGGEVKKETWTLWDRKGHHRRWEVEYPADKDLGADDEIPEVDPPDDPVGGIPIVRLELPPELWLMNHLGEPALELFRKANALSWSIDRTCYAMPAFFLKSKKDPPRMGAGYYLMLGADEKIEWPAPSAAPYGVIAEYLASRKDELYRVAQQMAQGVSNNAAAVGRSGESKLADAQATEIVLRAYGAKVREAAERTLTLLAEGRDEDVTWSVSGMDSYRVADAEALTATAATAQLLQIPSATYKRELLKRVAYALMPDLDEAKKKLVATEIEAGITDASVLPQPVPPGQAPVDGATDPALVAMAGLPPRPGAPAVRAPVPSLARLAQGTA